MPPAYLVTRRERRASTLTPPVCPPACLVRCPQCPPVQESGACLPKSLGSPPSLLPSPPSVATHPRAVAGSLAPSLQRSNLLSACIHHGQRQSFNSSPSGSDPRTSESPEVRRPLACRFIQAFFDSSLTPAVGVSPFLCLRPDSHSIPYTRRINKADKGHLNLRRDCRHHLQTSLRLRSLSTLLLLQNSTTLYKAYQVHASSPSTPPRFLPSTSLLVSSASNRQHPGPTINSTFRASASLVFDPSVISHTDSSRSPFLPCSFACTFVRIRTLHRCLACLTASSAHILASAPSTRSATYRDLLARVCCSRARPSLPAVSHATLPRAASRRLALPDLPCSILSSFLGYRVVVSLLSLPFRCSALHLTTPHRPLAQLNLGQVTDY